MKLNKSDIKVLLDFGETMDDIPQIKNALRYLKLTNEKGERVKKEDAYKKLGQVEFLSGLDRAAFHATSYRSGISFDCHDLWSEKATIQIFGSTIAKHLKNVFDCYKELSKQIANFIVKQERHYGYNNYCDSDVAAIIRGYTHCDEKLSNKLALEIRGL